jgi:hypothetical protein
VRCKVLLSQTLVVTGRPEAIGNFGDAKHFPWGVQASLLQTVDLINLWTHETRRAHGDRVC